VRLLIFKKIYLLKGITKDCIAIKFIIILIFSKYKAGLIKFLFLAITARIYSFLNVKKNIIKNYLNTLIDV
jgi:hypothetical protein